MLRQTIANNASLVLALGGLLLGVAFGEVVYRTNYCAMGSLSDIHNFNDYRRFRAWILAAASSTWMKSGSVSPDARSWKGCLTSIERSNWEMKPCGFDRFWPGP